MKKTLKHLFSAAICAIMLFACVFPNFAAADTELSSVDAEKLEAFLPSRQVTEGITSIIRIMRAGCTEATLSATFRKVPVSALRTVSSVGLTLTPMQWEAFCALPGLGFSPPLLRRFRFVRNIGNECLLPGAGSNAYYGGEP